VVLAECRAVDAVFHQQQTQEQAVAAHLALHPDRDIVAPDDDGQHPDQAEELLHHVGEAGQRVVLLLQRRERDVRCRAALVEEDARRIERPLSGIGDRFTISFGRSFPPILSPACRRPPAGLTASNPGGTTRWTTLDEAVPAGRRPMKTPGNAAGQTKGQGILRYSG
jgi:hypothetical protein